MKGDRSVADQPYHEPWFLIREHANGWIGQIEASEQSGKWHVAAYPSEHDGERQPVKGYVTGQQGAMQLADTLVKDHAPHQCRRCGPWRRADEQRLAASAAHQARLPTAM